MLRANAQMEPPDPTLQQRPPEGPTLTVTTREVLLDAVVTDASGRPVTGLKASDFSVSEEGVPQQIASMDEHHPMSAEDVARAQGPALPPNTFSNYTPIPTTDAYTVILLDALDTHVQDQMVVREQLIGYLKKMQPGTPVAIFQLDLHMHLIQGFTTDPKVLLAAAESKGDHPSLLKPMFGSLDTYILANNETLEDGFRIMGRYLAGFPGRKNLIWLTGVVAGTNLAGAMYGGIPFGNPFIDDFSLLGDDPNNMTAALTLSRVAVYPIDARGLLAAPQFDASRRGVPGTGSIMNWLASQDAEHMYLDSVAEATGGKAYYNSNGLKQILAQIVNDGSNYYTIAYSTTNQQWNGQFRRIKLNVDRPGLKLEYKPGYYAINRDQQQQNQLAALRRKGLKSAGQRYNAGAAANGNAPSAANAGAVISSPRAGFDAAMQLGAVPPTEIIFAANLRVGSKIVKLDRNSPLPADNFLRPDFKTKPFHTYTVHIQADMHSVRMTRTADGIRHGALQFVTVVYSPTGEVVNSMQTTASFDFSPAKYRKILAAGLGASQEIAVPIKGSYFFRIGVHDITSDRVGALELADNEVRANVPGQQAAAH